MKLTINTVAALIGGFFSPKEKDSTMDAQKKKAPIPCKVTELNKTNKVYFNTLIALRKYPLRLAQSRHTALLIAELYSILSSAYLIAMAQGLYCLLGGVV